MMALPVPRMARLLTGMALTAVVAIAPAAQIYQWKDENGQTVFSATPPPQGAREVVKPRYAKESPEAIEQLRARTAPKEPAQAAKTEPPKGPSAEEKAEKCRKAREIRTQLETSRRLREKNEKGELQYISEEERVRRVGETDKSIEAWCK